VTRGASTSDPAIPNSDPTIPRRLLRPILAFARVVNPAVLRLAGRRGVPIALVRHRGRHSGQRYANPVIAFQTGDGFVISLPYGSGANWCRNTVASGSASVRWQGVEHPVVRAEVLGPTEALPLFPAALRPVLRLVRLRQFLWVHSATPVG
jgi:deazaflavin-dependent oxidoreductase (nitroreductase family)